MFLLGKFYLFLFNIHLKFVKFSILGKCIDVVIEVIGSDNVVSLDERRVVKQERWLFSVHKIITRFWNQKRKPTACFLQRLSSFINNRLLISDGILGGGCSFGILHLEYVDSSRVWGTKKETIIITKIQKVLRSIFDSSSKCV